MSLLSQSLPSARRPSELALGQSVVVAARWVLIGAGLLLAIWDPAPVAELRVQIAVLLLLAIANFYLQTQILRGQPTFEPIAHAASMGDLAVITLLVLTQGGFASPLYVFYFPALLAVSVAFPTAVTMAFTLLVLGAYGAIGVLTGPADLQQQVLAVRLIALLGVAVCGNLYWRLEHQNRVYRSAGVDAGSALDRAHDFFFGQVALNWARWALVGGTALVALWSPATNVELAQRMVPVVLLLGLNCFLHGRYLMGQPVNRSLLLGAAVVDVALVGVLAMVASAPEAPAHLLVLLFSSVLAFALVFPGRATLGFTGLALLVVVVDTLAATPTGLSEPATQKVLVERLVTLTAMGGLGAYYWRLVRRGRHQPEPTKAARPTQPFAQSASAA